MNTKMVLHYLRIVINDTICYLIKPLVNDNNNADDNVIIL